MKLSEIKRYNQGFGGFGPMEQCQTGKWTHADDVFSVISEQGLRIQILESELEGEKAYSREVRQECARYIQKYRHEVAASTKAFYLGGLTGLAAIACMALLDLLATLLQGVIQ